MQQALLSDPCNKENDLLGRSMVSLRTISSSSTTHVFAYFVLILLAQSYHQFRRNQRKVARKSAGAAAVKAPAVIAVEGDHHHHHRRLVRSLKSLEEQQRPQVNYGDWIYLKGDWDGSPVVLEEYKLVFFSSAKVGCTTFKMLFRRMMGLPDWNVEEYENMLPWNPETNGLKYLYDFDRERATEIMTNPDWTRAIFVRDPKERFLSAYLDKVIHNPNYLRKKCCFYKGDCVDQAWESLQGFLEVARFCDDSHWRPQSRRIDARFWPLINFVGHMESIAEDTERLLMQIGAWDQFGKLGWGVDGDEPVFGVKTGEQGRLHATNARAKLQQYISPELEVVVDEFYADDYANPTLGLEKINVFGGTPGG